MIVVSGLQQPAFNKQETRLCQWEFDLHQTSSMLFSGSRLLRRWQYHFSCKYIGKVGHLYLSPGAELVLNPQLELQRERGRFIRGDADRFLRARAPFKDDVNVLPAAVQSTHKHERRQIKSRNLQGQDEVYDNIINTFELTISFAGRIAIMSEP